MNNEIFNHADNRKYVVVSTVQYELLFLKR